MLHTKLTSNVYVEHGLNTVVYAHDVRLEFGKVVLMHLCVIFVCVWQITCEQLMSKINGKDVSMVHTSVKSILSCTAYKVGFVKLWWITENFMWRVT